jgi:hypothetical protein
VSGAFKDGQPARASRIDWLWVLTCAVLSSVWIVTASQQLSATFDETAYLKVGLERWRTGSFRALQHMGTMPLPVDVCTLPLYLTERLTGRAIDLDAEMAEWLPVGRVGTLVFWWLLLIYAWRTGNLLGGPWAGRWAAAVLAVEPSFLAHAGLATTDLASAACLLALAFHYRAALNRPGEPPGLSRRFAAPAIWFAVALLAKASAVVYGPICLLAAECDHHLPENRSGGFRGSALRIAGVAGLGFILAGLYCGSIGRLVDVIAFQFRHNLDGHGGTFLLGRSSDTPFWYYFPTLLTIKLPLPLLAAPLVIAILRPRALANWPLAAAGAMLLVSLTCRIQIGVRYLLPMMALAVVGLAAAGVQSASRHSRGAKYEPAMRRGLAFAAGAAVVAMALTAFRIWPHGLSYTNGLWGPADRGYLLLADSNYDWGQGLYELAAWQRSSAAGPLDVVYFGTDPTLARLDMRPVNPADFSAGDPGRSRKLAVSTTMLYGQPFGESEFGRRLRAQTPVARTATFLVFDLHSR